MGQTVELDDTSHDTVVTPDRSAELIENCATVKKYIADLKILMLDEFDKLLDAYLILFGKKAVALLAPKRQTILTTNTFDEHLVI